MCQVSYSKQTEYGSKDKLKNFDGSPKWAFIEITSKCSHKCKWCYGGFNEDTSGEISIEDYKMLLLKLKKIGITQITLSGGEPTEHRYFDEILKLSSDGFVLNLVTHGDWKDSNLAVKLKESNVNQVQFNYQGKKHHDSIHGVAGSYDNQRRSIQLTKDVGIHVVGSLTVGKYNLDSTADVFNELVDLGADRLRVWETVGFGNKFRKDLEAKEIFDETTKRANNIGYNFIQSYDPLVKGDVGVSCLALSGLYMYINNKCEHIFCGAVVSQLKKPLSNMLTDSADTILENQRAFNIKHKRDKPYCMARDDIEVK